MIKKEFSSEEIRLVLNNHVGYYTTNEFGGKEAHRFDVDGFLAELFGYTLHREEI